MSDLPAVPTAAKAIATQPDKPKPISPKIRAAIDSLVNGEAKTVTDAAVIAGLSREHLSRELGKPHIAARLKNKTLRNLAISAARAGAVKTELMASPNEMVKDRASTFILGLAGIQPAASPSVHVNIEMKAGYVIDLSDDPKVIEHE
jgi:hypothetical protein